MLISNLVKKELRMLGRNAGLMHVMMSSWLEVPLVEFLLHFVSVVKLGELNGSFGISFDLLLKLRFTEEDASYLWFPLTPFFYPGFVIREDGDSFRGDHVFLKEGDVGGDYIHLYTDSDICLFWFAVNANFDMITSVVIEWFSDKFNKQR